MRVVSQSRNYSFDFDRTVFWTQYNVIYAKIGIDSIAIGQYESDQRAVEVFDDMHKAYSSMPILFQNDEISDDLQQKLKEWNANCIVAHLPDARLSKSEIQFITCRRRDRYAYIESCNKCIYWIHDIYYLRVLKKFEMDREKVTIVGFGFMEIVYMLSLICMWA